MNYKNLIYVISCIAFIIIIGAGVFEHVAVWPRAFSAIPQSLSMFQGKYALNAAPFWMTIHPVNLLLMTVTLILFWKTDSRKNLLITLVGYVTILAVTFTYFVPELLELTKTTYTDSVYADLTKRGATWEKLSLARLAVLLVLAAILLTGLTKLSSKTNRS